MGLLYCLILQKAVSTVLRQPKRHLLEKWKFWIYTHAEIHVKSIVQRRDPCLCCTPMWVNLGTTWGIGGELTIIKLKTMNLQDSMNIIPY